ncbi:MAG: anti-anti-sigma factor [Flavobacteriales bacterium]|jgi:anti-anti-sigma factor
MAIQVDVNGIDVKISLSERFDFACVEEFRQSYESVSVVGKKAVVIDFRGTRYMDSSALGMLIDAKSHFSQSDSKVTLLNCNDQIKKIFSISRFDKKFDIN